MTLQTKVTKSQHIFLLKKLHTLHTLGTSLRKDFESILHTLGDSVTKTHGTDPSIIDSFNSISDCAGYYMTDLPEIIENHEEALMALFSDLEDALIEDELVRANIYT